MRHKIPAEILAVCEGLRGAGHEAYLVGGCVRDLVLNRIPKDWDVTTDATPEEIQEIFPDSFYENTFGTVGVKTRSEDPRLFVVEVTPYRIEGKYSDARRPDEVRFSKHLEDDLERRDLPSMRSPTILSERHSSTSTAAKRIWNARYCAR
jgi:tRNA nucleotidyltransferase (CCA-adding enzyme)